MEGGLIPSAGTGILTVKGLCVWAGVFLVFVGGMLLFFIQDEATELLARAAALEGEAQTFLDERDKFMSQIEGLFALDQKRLALIDANRSMRETLEQSLLIPAADAHETTQAMLENAKRLVLMSIGFGIDEEWAISVFKVNGDELVRIAAMRAGQLPPPALARTWKENEGFVGRAWATEQPVIVPDGTVTDVLDQFTVPQEKRREYDAARYRSMAAVPIRTGDPAQIWGVVAASTSCPGRFRRDPGNKQVQAVDTVRLIARMTGLAAVAFARSEV
ncbi:GAF domain-containing protein [Sphingomonas sp. CFBP 13720]|uniref:GAF domain-containing protein n=1 Tax=Sphingomonas sp. CFBP 13720 TaxID=2775302 RepID=UPI00177C27E2|nr:GAF domain-containing protein [Sphingomonas sp. CFBP 13720]MBD8679251.1 GAF domain-containing protein [Sphingomonas sp. CFBP 13720]